MYRYDQLHPVSESTSSPLHMFRNNIDMSNRPPSSISSPTSFSTDMNSQHLISPSLDGTQNNIDHITCLERSLCSNFLCCGTQLVDLHALLDHFEEQHIMVLAPNGKRVYPREGLRTVPLHSIQTTFTTPSESSRASSLSPSSTSSSSSAPSTPSDFSSPDSGPFASRKSSLTAAVTPVYTPFTPSLPVDPADPYPDTEEITMLQEEPIYEFPIDVYPSTLPLMAELISPLSSSDEDEEMSDCSGIDLPASPITAYVCPTDKVQNIATPTKRVKFADIAPRGRHSTKLSENQKAASASKSKARNRHSSTGPSTSSKRREKSFHCPSYLNPNGLKYHMEKGTCNIEGETDERDGMSIDMEMLPPTASDAQAQGTGTPTPTANLSRHDAALAPAIDAEARTPSGPELDPKSQFVPPQQQQLSNSPSGPYYCPWPFNAAGEPASVSATTTPRNAPPDLNSNLNAHTAERGATKSLTQSKALEEPSPAEHRAETPRQLQQQHQAVYHYPVPSYPQLGGPNALLAGYTTFIHRPYFTSADRAPSTRAVPTAAGLEDGSHLSHTHAYSPLPPPPPVSASNSSRLQ